MEGSSRNVSKVEGFSTERARPAEWRSQLTKENRRRVAGRIMNSLKKHFPPGASEGLNDLQKLAVRFEQKMFTLATSQADYLRKISSKLLALETRVENAPGINSPASLLAAGSQGSDDPVSLGMQSQGSNQGQSLAIPHVNQSLVQPPLLPENHQHRTTSATLQLSKSLAHRMSSVSGFSQSTVANAVKTSHLQNMSIASQNSGNSSAGQGLTPNMYASGQRQLRERQQKQMLTSQQHQQRSQNPLIYQHQLQQQLLKYNVSHPSLLQLQIQQQQQQQALLHPNQLQSSQQPLVQMASSLQSGQSTVQQTQPTITQSASQPNPAVPSSLQQHPQLVARQQQAQPIIHQHSSSLQQESTSVPQQSILLSSQRLMGQQSSVSDVQHSQILGQKNSALDIQQQQRLPGQKNNLISMQQSQPMSSQQTISLHQQQQLGLQSNISGVKPQLQPQQQQQLIFESHSSASNMQQHQSAMASLQRKMALTQQSQGRLPQNQLSQQKLISQVQSQPPRLQQQLTIHQLLNSLQQEMQPRPQTSGVLPRPQNMIEEQRSYIHSQGGLPEATSGASIDSTAQIGNAGVVDWQEEMHQEIISWKKYSADLNELNGKVAQKIQELHDEGVDPATKQSEQYEKMKLYKSVLETILHLFQISKSNINSDLKRKFPFLQKYMKSFINSNNSKSSVPSQPQGHSQSIPQHPPSQDSQLQQHENRVNQVQQINSQHPVASMQSAVVPSTQHGSVPLSAPINVTTQLDMPNTMQPSPSLDPTQQESLNSMQQETVGSIHQGGVGSSQTSTGDSEQLHLKQQQQEVQQQLCQTEQMKQQFQQHQIQELMHHREKQQLIQQSSTMQLHQQQKQLQATQLPLLQMPQHQNNDVNELKGRQNSGIKSGLYQQHYPAGQHHNYSHQQLRICGSFPISSPEKLNADSSQICQCSSPQLDQNTLSSSSLPKAPTSLQSANSPFVPSPSIPKTPSPMLADSEKHSGISSLSSAVVVRHQEAAFASPQSYSISISTPGILSQISQRSSPQLDQNALLSSSLPKAPTSLQSANSPLVPSPSIPKTPSPILADSEKHSGISSLSNAVVIGHQEAALSSPQSYSISISTPRISSSLLLEGIMNPDGSEANVVSTLTQGKSSVKEQPLARLIKAVRSLPPEQLSSSVNDMRSVVSMIDGIASSTPGNGSKAAIGEDLAALTRSHLQAQELMSQDGNNMTEIRKRNITAMPLHVVPSDCSLSDSFMQLHQYNISEPESIATSSFKRQKVEVNHALLEEINEINQNLIGTMITVCKDADSVAAAARREGTVIKCSFSAVFVCPNLKSQLASAQMSPIMPLRFLIPTNYPKCSPILLDPLSSEPSKEFGDLSGKAWSRFRLSLRGLPHPLSLRETIKAWNNCARKVIEEYAQQTGGGSFSSRFGAWENCVST